MEIGEALREIRRSRGLTQASLPGAVEKVGYRLSEAMVAAVESGRRNLRPEAVDAIADALKLTKAERSKLHAAREARAHADRASTVPRRLEEMERRLLAVEARLTQMELDLLRAIGTPEAHAIADSVDPDKQGQPVRPAE